MIQTLTLVNVRLLIYAKQKVLVLMAVSALYWLLLLTTIAPAASIIRVKTAQVIYIHNDMTKQLTIYI